MALVRKKVLKIMMICPKRILLAIIKMKNLKMGGRGGFLLFLICAATCAVVYFMYILNSVAEDKTSRYEAIVQEEYQKYSPSEQQFEDFVEKDSMDAQHGQNSSNLAGHFDQVEESTSSEEFASHQDNQDVPKDSNTGIETMQLQHAASNNLVSSVLPKHSAADWKGSREISKRKTSNKTLSSISYSNSNFKLMYFNNDSAGKPSNNGKNNHEFPGLNNETIRRIEDNLIDWKKKEESRLLEDRKILEEGKQKLLEEKIRFQQEMGHVMQELRRGNIVNIQQKLAPRLRRPVDPVNWEGLNNTLVDSRYPGLVFMEDYRLGRPFVAPEDASAAGMQGGPKSLSELLDSQAEERFFQLISGIHIDCIVVQRMGSLTDGGWDVCTVPPFDLKPGCLVYSFGINYDFTFDDAMAASFDCSVKAFDPSMSVGDHVRSARVHFYQLGLGAQNTVTTNGWKLNTFRHICKKLGHEKSVIDILKVDIEFYEWECIRQMLNDNSLENVKQLMFEMHTPEVAMVQRPSAKEDFAKMYELLSDLEKAGFRRYNVHMNPLGQYTSSRTGKTRSCCFELYYVNIRFLGRYKVENLH